MTAVTIPPNNKDPITLKSGDTLTVNTGGTSTDVTVNDGATETVNNGGTSLRTTVNDGGQENVRSGTADRTTINGGDLAIFHGRQHEDQFFAFFSLLPS
jgi:autotransporter passenger strand-loop-strand repeat protein